MRHTFTPNHPQWAQIKDFTTRTQPKIGLAVARFNTPLTQQLALGATTLLTQAGLHTSKLARIDVPGAFELPLMAQHLIEHHYCQAVICLGVVIKGDTPHFDYVCQHAAHGIQTVALTTKRPVIFGVLTTHTLDQAETRANPEKDNIGGYSALSALEMLASMVY
jgi:6,7-dimethyl-8-ribityllumazine synthase